MEYECAVDVAWELARGARLGLAAAPTAYWIVAIAIVAALLLAAPGQTVSARYLNDLMMFLDGAHRIVSGQVPHRDFHTPMGAVTNGLPAIGLWLTGSLDERCRPASACSSSRWRR